MEAFKQKLRSAGFAGEIETGAAAKEFYSHDASIFEVRPQMVVFPADVRDVCVLVKTVAAHKKNVPALSVTARSAGTDMSGGAVNDSVIADFTKHFTAITGVTPKKARTQPGVYYRDFETETLKYDALMPSYPASRDLCTVGGMVANNAGGEKSLEYGKVDNFTAELKVVFADGNEYTVKPLSKPQLVAKMAQGDYEGNLYKKLFKLIEDNYDTVKSARPNVTKVSMGYGLWDVWNRETGVFDMTKLIVGSQGTLGLITEVTFRLVPVRPYSGLLVCFMKDIRPLGEVINKVLEHKPATFEGFDDHTLYQSIRHFTAFRKFLGTRGLLKMLFSLIPDAPLLLRGIPKLVLMAEFNGETQEEVDMKIEGLRRDLKPFGMPMERDETAAKSQKFWMMRRQSFNLLRNATKDKHTAPFIDDLVVNPVHLPEFLPRLREIIKQYGLIATIAGHMGDGNFHIIPLMKMDEPDEKAKLLPVMEKVDNLVLHYHGCLSGEHNDGLVRGPWLEVQFGKTVVDLFKRTKAIFDPDNIFNPHKKTDADWDYGYRHIREHF